MGGCFWFWHSLEGVVIQINIFSKQRSNFIKGGDTLNFKISKKCFNAAYLPQLNNYSKRFNVYYGGAGSGKSHFVVQKMIYKYLKYPGRKCLVARKVSSTLRESIFALFKSVIGDWQLYEQCKVNKTYDYWAP